MQPPTSIWVLSVALVLSIGCEKQEPPGAKQEAAQQEAAPAKPSKSYDFPSLTVDWGPKEYTQARDALVALDQDPFEQLVKLDGPHGDVLTRFASTEQVAKAIAAHPDVDGTFAIADAVVTVYRLYMLRVYDEQPYGGEFLLLTSTVLHTGIAQFERLVPIGGEANDDPGSREGRTEARHGILTVYLAALSSPLDAQPVDAAAAMAELGAIAGDIAPFMLPNERQLVDQILLMLIGMGADPARGTAARLSVAEATMHPMLAAFVDEAQAFSAQRSYELPGTREQKQPTVEEPRGSDGVRYGFPDAGFSAVFPQQPNAMLANATAKHRVTTIRTLGTRDENGHATAIVCASRPVPPSKDGQTFAREAIERTKVTDMREVQIDGRNGFEATTSSGIMQTVDVERGGCMIIVESPPELAEGYEKQTRVFLESVQLGH